MGKSITYEIVSRSNVGCEVVAILKARSLFSANTSNRKPLSINDWKFQLRQIICTGGGLHM